MRQGRKETRGGGRDDRSLTVAAPMGRDRNESLLEQASAHQRPHRSRDRKGADRTSPLIIGYGNPLRGDDAVGPRLAAGLGGIAVHQLLPELAERIAAERRVLFIDARTDLEPGEVRAMPVDGGSASTHWCSPGSLLRLAREAYGRAPEAVLIGIGAESFEFGAPLSAAARRGMRKALAQIRALGWNL